MAAAAAAASPPPPPPPLDICTVLTESKRIINAHSRHFLALSVLFLLPISFSLTVFPTLQNLLSQPSTHPNSRTLISFSFSFSDDTLIGDLDSFTTRTLILSALFSLFVFLFSILALGSITYSVLHGFYGRPVKLFSAIKSAFTSFFYLLLTTILMQSILLFVFLASGCSLFLVAKVFKIDFASPYFLGFALIVLIVSVLISVYLQLNWALVGAIVVVESSFGIEPLKRSSFLIKGMRGVALGLLLFFGFLVSVLLILTSVSGMTLSIGVSNGWKSCGFVLQIVVTSTFLMLLLLYNVAANTVLYMYCKAVHGELAWEIAEEFAREYVSLPFDDGKVPHLVSVAYT